MQTPCRNCNCRDSDNADISPFTDDICCSLWNETNTFAIDLVEAFAAESSASEFSAVYFADEAVEITGLTSSSAAKTALSNLVYMGGFTNHAAALNACQETFSGTSDPDTPNTILLVTDGAATRPTDSATGEQVANEVFANITAQGTFIRPVVINADLLNTDQMAYINGLSSDGIVNEVGPGNFTGIIDDLVDPLLCGEPTVSPTASPTNSPTVSPTLSPTKSPTTSPTVTPTISPTVSPTTPPTVSPTTSPTSSPTESPTKSPTVSPTVRSKR